MDTEELKRLKDDLSTMRQAMKLDKPYDAADIPVCLLVALGGLVAIALFWWQVWQPRSVLVVAMAPAVGWYIWRHSLAKKNQAERPNLWTEYRWSMFVAVGVAIAAPAWIWWCRRQGITHQAAGAGIIFCMGLVALGIGLMVPSRRSYLFGAVSVIVFAFAYPSMSQATMPFAGATLLIVMGFGTAAILWWQTRGDSERLQDMTLESDAFKAHP